MTLADLARELRPRSAEVRRAAFDNGRWHVLLSSPTRAAWASHPRLDAAVVQALRILAGPEAR